MNLSCMIIPFLGGVPLRLIKQRVRLYRRPRHKPAIPPMIYLHPKLVRRIILLLVLLAVVLSLFLFRALPVNLTAPFQDSEKTGIRN
jgi:uncharacterized membrane protein